MTNLQEPFQILTRLEDTRKKLTELLESLPIRTGTVSTPAVRQYQEAVDDVGGVITYLDTSIPSDIKSMVIHIRNCLEQISEFKQFSTLSFSRHLLSIAMDPDLRDVSNADILSEGLISIKNSTANASSKLLKEMDDLKLKAPGTYTLSRSVLAETRASQLKHALVQAISMDIPETFNSNNISRFLITPTKTGMPDDDRINGCTTSYYARQAKIRFGLVREDLATVGFTGTLYKRHTGGVSAVTMNAAALLPAGTVLFAITNPMGVDLTYTLSVIATSTDFAGAGNVVDAATYTTVGVTYSTRINGIATGRVFDIEDDNRFSTSFVLRPGEVFTIVTDVATALNLPTGAPTATAVSLFVRANRITADFASAIPNGDWMQLLDTAMPLDVRTALCSETTYPDDVEKAMDVFAKYFASSRANGRHIADVIFPAAVSPSAVPDGDGGFVRLANRNEIFASCFWIELKGNYPNMGSVADLYRLFLRKLELMRQVIMTDESFLSSMCV
jgi:hypothetical protein